VSTFVLCSVAWLITSSIWTRSKLLTKFLYVSELVSVGTKLKIDRQLLDAFVFSSHGE
jgi:hypothetical protein